MRRESLVEVASATSCGGRSGRPSAHAAVSLEDGTTRRGAVIFGPDPRSGRSSSLDSVQAANSSSPVGDAQQFVIRPKHGGADKASRPKAQDTFTPANTLRRVRTR